MIMLGKKYHEDPLTDQTLILIFTGLLFENTSSRIAMVSYDTYRQL